MNYYNIAGYTIRIDWPEDNPQEKYYLYHDCAVLPRSLAAFEINDDTCPDKVDLVIKAGVYEPDINWVDYKRLGNQFYMETEDYYITSYRLGISSGWPIGSLKMKKDYSEVIHMTHDLKYLNYDLQRTQYAFEGRVLTLGGIVLHGAAIEYEGKGIIFTGISGAGKSTQAHLWQKYENALIINGDCPVIKNVTNNEGKEEVRVYGTPWCGTSGEYINRNVELDSIVMVKKANTNSVTKLEGREKFMTVLSQVLRSNTDSKSLDLAISNLSAMIDKINVYCLECTKDEEAVKCLKRVLK